MSSIYEREGQDVVRPTAPHVAVTLVLDVSASMNALARGSTCIKLLNDGVNHLIEGLANDSDCRDIVDLSIIAFGQTARVYQRFSPVGSIEKVDFPANDNNTLVAEAIEMANANLRSRTREYRAVPFTPWMVIMTDGGFGDDLVQPGTISQIGRDLKTRVSEGKLQTMCLGIGNEYDDSQLAQLSEHAYALDNYDFKEFMGWLRKALAIISKSKQGDDVDLGVPQGLMPMKTKS